MSLRPASYKGVSFYVEDTSADFGRRTVLHKYPYRDVPFAEDLGRDTRGFTFTAFVMSQGDHDKLVDALESEGGGTLIHPFYGTQFVVHQGKAQVQYPHFSGGRFVFQLSFTEAGENTEPDALEDAGGALDSLINDALDAVGLDFADGWLNDIEGWADMAANRVDALLAGFESYLSPLEQGFSAIQSIVSGGQSLLSKPLELFYRVSGLIQQATHVQLLPFGSKLDLGRNLAKSPSFSVANRPDTDAKNLLVLSGNKPQQGARPAWTYPYSPTDIRDIPPLPPALADAVRRTLVLEKAEELATGSFDSKNDILTARDDTLALISNELYQCDGDVYRRFQDVRAQVVATAAARIPTLREIDAIHTKAVLPALVLAYRVNGTLDAYDDIVARNRVTHPLFVPAGTVEVIRDGE